MIPTVGRIVHYKLEQQNVTEINRRREDAHQSLEWHREHKTGAQIHMGNPPAVGQIYPMIITCIWGADSNAAVNGQVLLDGNDTLWVTSRFQGGQTGQWQEPPRV